MDTMTKIAPPGCAPMQAEVRSNDNVEPGNQTDVPPSNIPREEPDQTPLVLSQHPASDAARTGANGLINTDL